MSFWRAFWNKTSMKKCAGIKKISDVRATEVQEERSTEREEKSSGTNL